MELAKLNPFVRYARKQINLPLREYKSICYDCRLFFIRQGSGSIEMRHQTLPFSENTIIYLPPRTTYRIVPKAEGNSSILVFNFDLVSDFSHLKSSLGTAREDCADLSLSPGYPVPEDFSCAITTCLPHLFEPLERCTKDYLTRPPYYQETTSVVVKAALLELLKNRGADHNSRISGQVTDYIHNLFQSPELTNRQIAEHFGYHPYYLSQLLKNTTGKTLHNYLLSYRIRVAKNYLITTDWDIETVSWKSGFNSVSYFIKMFHATTGVTPRHYRLSHANSIF